MRTQVEIANMYREKAAVPFCFWGDDATVTFAEDDSNYPQYGAPILKHICEKYGLPVPGNRGILRMAEGLPCCDGCEEGCGP